MRKLILVMVLISGCAVMDKREADILDIQTEEIPESRQEETQKVQQYRKNTFEDVYLQDVRPMVKPETKPTENTYKIEISAESISLSEFCSIMLTNTEISFSSIVDVPSVYVNIQGEYRKSEIIEIIQRVCNGVGCKFVESKNIYTIEKEVEGNISSMGVLGYRCKYVVPSTTEIINFLGKIKNVYVYVAGVNVVVVGSKQDLEVMQEFLRSFDKNIFEGYKMAFVVCADVPATVEKIKTIISSFSNDALNSVGVIPVSKTVLCIVSRVAEYVETVKNMVGMVSGYMNHAKEIFTIPLKYKKALDAVEFVKKSFPDMVLSADEEVNTVYLKGSLADYQTVLAVLENYDIQPEQMIFKVYLIDIRSTNNLDMGSDWFVDAGKYKLEKTELISPLKGGFNSIIGIGNITSFFSLLQKKFDGRVVSRPVLYMKSGQSSELKFGSSVPYIGTKATTGVSNGVVQNVTYRDVGVIVKITASVAEDKQIMVNVYIENSAMNKNSGVEGNPIFTSDSIKTDFIVPDGAMCILGGIKFKNREEVKQGIPYIVDHIPFLSYILGAVSRSEENRELIICVNPKILTEEKVSFIGERILKTLTGGFEHVGKN